ncbi:hypothetical protein FA95DRAFT_1555189 [Auriscalpium vulgare]|uniref:Uncharacterized protein n=1 Tax=Auriscalpium vulgare TaxID=40419 RepID=A0ACB8S309_9AGAM|nr:hypothetical protein FA95DRAFT_1555189 [Auriscalpium vulgare]
MICIAPSYTPALLAVAIKCAAARPEPAHVIPPSTGRGRRAEQHEPCEHVQRGTHQAQSGKARGGVEQEAGN